LINSGPKKQAFIQTGVSIDEKKKKNTAFFQGSIQIDDYHAPSKDIPFIESYSCPCDFPAQIDVIVFSLAVFRQPSCWLVTPTLIL